MITLLFKKPLNNTINVTKLNKNLIETEDLASVATVFNRIARQLAVLFLIKVIELRLILMAGVSYENAVVCENLEKILIRKKITAGTGLNFSGLSFFRALSFELGRA